MEILIDNILLTELAKGYQPGFSCWVNVTHIDNPHSFYVRPTKYGTLLESLEKQAPTSSYNDVNIQDIITFNLNNTTNTARYARGQIIERHENNGDITCDIIALDYGFIKKALPLSQILECNEIVCNIPPLAMHCQLANCSSIIATEWSKECIESFKFFIGDGKVKMEVVGRFSDKLNVNIINTFSDDLASLLSLTGLSILDYNHSTICRMTNIIRNRKVFNFKNIIKNDTLHVRMQNGSSLEEFYVAEIGDFKNYQIQKVNISNAVNREKELLGTELIDNMPVCVLNNHGEYERAVVKSYSDHDSKAIVQLVDSGEKLRTHISNMKTVPDSGLNYMANAIYCIAEDCQLYDSSLRHILRPGYEFFITIKEPGRALNTPSIVKITSIEKH